MDEIARKWKDKHYRCRNCAYLSPIGVLSRECAIKGTLIDYDDIYRSFLPPGMFCRYYKTKVEEDLND